MKLEDLFRLALAECGRIAICGGPNTGKTTLTKLVTDRPVIHSVTADEEIELGPLSVTVTGGYEPDTPLKLMAAVARLDRFVIEGVQVARALRGPKIDGIRFPGLQVDGVVYLNRPKVDERRKGQIAQAVGTRTIFDGWLALRPPVLIYEESLIA